MFKRVKDMRLGLACAAACLPLAMSAQANATSLAHRWDFSGNGQAYDSIGDANLTQFNGGYHLDGGKLIAADQNSSKHSDCLEATNENCRKIGNTFKANPEGTVTLEMWFNQSEDRPWSKLLMMGYGKEWGHADAYFAITTKGPADKLCVEGRDMAMNDAGYKNEIRADNFNFNLNTDYYMAVVLDACNDKMKLYIGDADGTNLYQQESAMDFDLDGLKLHNFGEHAAGKETVFGLGTAHFWGDKDWVGTYDEFRISVGEFGEADAYASLSRGADVVPEPTTAVLAGCGLLGLFAGRRRRRA